MTFTLEDIDNRLHFFSELVSYESNCYLWTYSFEGDLVYTNCSDLMLEKIFQRNGCHAYMMQYAQENVRPLLMSGQLGMMWGAVFEIEDGQLNRIHVLGPVYSQTITNLELEKAVWGRINPRWKPKYMKIMEALPVMSISMFMNRIFMMEYCVTGSRIRSSDIVMQYEKPGAEKSSQVEDGDGVYADHIQVYMAEQSLLRMIRNGDMNYQEVLQKSSRLFTGKQRLSGNALQHAKLGQVQFIALCCNAALDGGLSAEVAYSRKDAYIQDVENAKSISEITEIGRNMYVDYITLVHGQRLNPAYSKAVQSTCDYIENHLNQKMSAEMLASRVGYSGYYLSRRFKSETGFSIDEYTRNVKIERAKLLLTSTQDSIQDISDALGFGGRNYFAITFRKITGIPPAAYRKKYQKL